jgi:hypothetical protein
MIDPSLSPKDDKTYYRITLQGHGLYDKKKELTYYLLVIPFVKTIDQTHI